MEILPFVTTQMSLESMAPGSSRSEKERQILYEMATYSSVPAWRIPGTGEPGGLPSMGLHRVGHD